MAEAEVSEQIELVEEDFHDDPHKYYERWRARGPVHKVRFTHERGIPCWVVVGHAEARAALADPRLHKNSAGTIELFRRKGSAVLSNSDARALSTHMLNTDPPEHTRLRKLVNKAFTPRRVAALRPRIEEITAALLDEVAAQDEVELLSAFATPLPVTVICELLGVPFTDRDDFQLWTKILVGAAGDLADHDRASADMGRYLTALLADKRVRPGDDLLSGLATEQDEGDRLTDPELVAMAFLLLVAGHETTVNLIGNGTFALLRSRTQFDALRADPDGIPAAVEEFLRLDGPVGWATVRYTEDPVDIGGTVIPAGELVYVALSAADRDPERYHSPDELDIGRKPSGHVAFGHGIHFCVGAPLARMEAAVAFTALLDRFPKLALAPSFTPRWQPSLLMRGLTELPVRPHG
ncbi:cytochrome P450 [Nocardia nova]|uniref:Cytochrome P450 n=1 Tax=Nocardia nova TaxID=37330 RepID=A0A2S6AYJ7_9NOCA|nr:cytochrome P450 [Nocardia nova]PPJ34438.1 cytochrome P450 [Nocardia nova]PPJ40254.1 cytochrome P450 [Nocardia nova]